MNGVLFYKDLELVLEAAGTSLEDIVNQALHNATKTEKLSLDLISSLESKIATANAELKETKSSLKSTRRALKAATLLRK